MHSYLVSIFLNHSIIIAAVFGIARFKSVINTFYPFLFLIWIGCINESLSLVFIYKAGSNTVSSNIFVLIEFCLVLLQFYKWNHGENKFKYWLVAALGATVWIIDNFIINTIIQNDSLFRVVYAYIIVVFSIDQIGKIIVYERGILVKNAMFIICISFTFYFACKAFVEAFNMIHPGLSDPILGNLWVMMYFVNGISNLFYALAILWIPTRHEFMLPY